MNQSETPESPFARLTNLNKEREVPEKISKSKELQEFQEKLKKLEEMIAATPEISGIQNTQDNLSPFLNPPQEIKSFEVSQRNSRQPWKPDLASIKSPQSQKNANDPYAGSRFGKLRAIRPGPTQGLPKDWPDEPIAGPAPSANSDWGKNPVLSVKKCNVLKNRWFVTLTKEAEDLIIESEIGWKKIKDGSFTILDPGHMLLLAPFLGKVQRKKLGLSDLRVTPPEDCGGIPVIFRLRLVNGNLSMLHQRFQMPNWYRNKLAYFAIFPKNTILNQVFGLAGWNWIPSIRAWATPSLAVATSMTAYADTPLAKIIESKGCPSILHPYLRFSPSVYPLDDKYHLAVANTGKYQLSEPHAIWKGLSPHPGWRTTSGTALEKYIRYIPRPMANAVLQMIQARSLQDLDIGKSHLELENPGGERMILASNKSGKKTPEIQVCTVSGCKKPYGNNLVKLQTPHKCKNCTKRCMGWNEVLTQQRYTTKEAWRSMIENLAPLALQQLRDPNILPVDLTNEELDKLLPVGESYFPHQYDAIRHCSHWKISLQGDVMGAGKTLVALKTVQITTKNKPNPRILVIVPANLTLKWQQDAIRWNPTRKARILRTRDVPTQGEITILSYNTARTSKHIQAIQWDMIICDEAHSVKNMVAKRTKAIMKLESHRWMFITGTPLTNRPRDLFTYFHKAAPHIFNSAEKFAKCFPLEKPSHPTEFENRGLDLLANLLRSSIMIRRPKQVLLKNMPKERPPEIVPVVVPTQKGKEIQTIEQDFLENYKQMKISGGKNPAVFAQMNLLRKNIGIAKLPALRDFVDSVARAGEPFLIFTWQKEMARQILQKAIQAGLKGGLLTGDLNPQERFLTGEKFQQGHLDCVVGTIDASGVGLDLFRATQVAFAELDWSPAKIDQARGRAWRPGQKTSMHTKYFTVPESMIDSHIASLLAGKNRSSSRGLGDNSPTPQSVLEFLKLQEDEEKNKI